MNYYIIYINHIKMKSSKFSLSFPVIYYNNFININCLLIVYVAYFKDNKKI